MDKATLDSLEAKGVEQVMLEMAKGMHGYAPDSILRIEVQDWVSAKQYSATMEASKRRDKREEETLAIARSALSNSRRANIIRDFPLDRLRSIRPLNWFACVSP